MAHSGNINNVQYQYNDMQAILLNKLKESRQQFPDYDSKSIHVLAAVHDNVDGQLELCLQQESKEHTGERIVLIPYHLENSHWIGILIEFHSNGQIKRAEYIDSVNELDGVPDGLQKQFTKVYPNGSLQVKSVQKQNDSNNSTALTVDNLLIAANVRLPANINCSKEETSTLSSATYTPKEGNEYELSELQQKLNSGLQKYNFQNAGELETEIQDTTERIQRFHRQSRTEQAQEEMKFLGELKELKELSDKIARWTPNKSVSLFSHELKLQELRDKLNSGLTKINLLNVNQLPGEIQDAEERIQKYQKQGRKENAEDEMKFLLELQELKRISEEICTLTSVPSADLTHEPTTEPSLSALPVITEISTSDEHNKKRLYLEVLLGDMADIPSCAEKTIVELLVQYENRLLEGCTSSQEENVGTSSLEKLTDQIKREEFLMEDTKVILQDLKMHKDSSNYQSIVDCLKKLLQAIRPLNVLEIQRLVREAENTAELIRDKEIVLLIGETGTGKSTTIQFLTGSKMKKTRVEIASGKFLEHITIDGPPQNPQLHRISSSALNKSETRYITPVTVPLKDILGAHENGHITLCDAPGFSDTAGPEVDIANSLGVIEALKGTESVKLLVLSSYKSLGDRGQGIQKLAEILINMVNGIGDKLKAIAYVFTKYPPKTDICALLTDIKVSKVDTNSSLRSNSAFMAVLTDMIEKTEEGAFVIDPIHDNPKKLIRMLKNMKGIHYPAECFRFSMSGETRATIEKHVQRDRLGISYAMKNKDNKLMSYYLNDLKILKDLINKYDVPQIYEQSISSANESISRYCAEVKEKFNRVMTSRDGLTVDDIRDYKACVEYLQEIQLTKEHLGLSLPSPKTLMQNVAFHLDERRRTLQEEGLDSPLIEIYLDNFRMLKTSFNELETDYRSCCDEFEKHFDNLVQTAREPILKNDFKQVAEIFTKISKSSHILKNHLCEQINNKHNDIVQLLLRHLNMFLNEIDPILAKNKLNKDDINILNSHIETLRSAKENYVLRQYISTYVEMLKTIVEVGKKHSMDNMPPVYTTDLNDIYDEFIAKIIQYFDGIVLRITKRFEESDNHALENIGELVEDMNVIRTIPEVESKTARTYYSTVENIRDYMDQLRRDVGNQLIDSIDQPSESITDKQLIRSLSHLKNTHWIESVNPGKYDTSMNQLKEQVIEYAEQLQSRLKKLDLSLKCPDNVSIAQQIVEKIESMKILEPDFPQLENYRNAIFRHVLQCTEVVLNSIEKDFNFSDQIACEEDEKLKQIEESKGLPESSCPIAQPKTRQETELERIRVEKLQLINHIMILKSYVETYENILSPPTDRVKNKLVAMVSKAAVTEKKKTDAISYLQTFGYESIEVVQTTIFKFLIELQKTEEVERNLTDSQNRLESIKEENGPREEISLSSDGACNASQLLVKTVQDKTKPKMKSEKNKHLYRLNDRFRISTANNALVYIRHCEQITNDCIRALTARAYEIVRDYLQQYSNFLEHRIHQNFRDGICNGASHEEDHSHYSQDLEISLSALSSLSRFQDVSECMEVSEKLERWQQELIQHHRVLSDKMQDYRISGESKELRDHLLIAQALICIDKFCGKEFENNGYGVLYRQYRLELIQGCKESSRIVLECITKGDYAKADVELYNIISSQLLNTKDSAQMKHDIQRSLNTLMNDTLSIANSLDGKIEKEKKRRNDILKEIKENVTTIRLISSKHNIMGLLGNETKSRLENFDNDINKILSAILLTGLDSIEDFIDADSFFEAERDMDVLSCLERELTGYCSSEDVTNKIKALNNRLANIDVELSKQNDFTDVHKYSINPPKYILAKLKMAASQCGGKYNKAYTSMFEIIRQNFTSAIENARATPLGERATKLRALDYASQFLPEEFQNPFRLQFEELSKSMADEEKIYSQDLETCFINSDEHEDAIKNIGGLAKQYTEQKLYELFSKLREQVLKKLHMYRTNVQSCLDMQSTVDTIRKIFIYKEFLSAYIPEIEGIWSSTHVLITKRFLNCSETLENISSFEETDLVEKAFYEMQIYLDFSVGFDLTAQVLLSEKIFQNATEGLRKMYQYLHDNSTKFRDALEKINIFELHTSVMISKKWDLLVVTINSCRPKHNLLQKLLEAMKKIIPYAEMISELENLINRLNIQFNVELVNDDTTKFEAKRDELFSNIKTTLSTIKAINSKFKDLLPSPSDVNGLEENLKAKIERIIRELLARASKKELSIKDADEFRMYYNHLLSFDKNVNLSGFNIRTVLDFAEKQILDKVIALRKQITSSSASIEEISQILIKMKFLAENLSLFDSKINAEIDEGLKIYKEKKGMVGIMQVIAELQKIDPDTRLISEHSCLTGEGWRRRRAKMQKQDDIEYILNELTGGEISKQVLRSRYQAFRKKFDELVSSRLKSFDPNTNKKPDIAMLVTQIKHIAGTVAHTSKSVTWGYEFTQNIPELLAYIFAVWTLKNTQHYNTLRGIETAQSYLLIPHVGQVITVFRLLGIGYESHAAIEFGSTSFTGTVGSSLINNLVQIGTGEGKSVVLAITACVFALIGVDVNCSCYSEVLSTRDKKDFISVFQALGIEDRIEYGTFNKLCEQLLNEKCNIREKVSDMIVNNNIALTVADRRTRIRPKVLLIDEVDVFLSDQFYGGTYTPAVYLKNPSIKALLDSIWQTQTLKTLNSVKALPAYKTCAAQFSNWMFLFDEAIKDMIAALQSFKGSTYIVHNDKIVYVEGESMVDNVVRGYDTIWAYYFENEKGKISGSSLETNVGIIINCGAFSYAEMPHDFAYIAGVTGTLKTLAKSEKLILTNVYNIRKNTYMPSVFGKNNRNYDETTDVEVVEKSGYFKRIHLEINAILKADRAILIFFESEETLMAFFYSPELSSIKGDVQIITETVSVKERELQIKRASKIGKVTLLTRMFGRGTDFICDNPKLLGNGGIHVVQTFFSKELSEEYQIMGRGARHGDRGSYKMILLDSDLEWVLGSTWKEKVSKIVGAELYKTINSARNILYESKCEAKNLGIEQRKRDHEDSKKFADALSTGDMKSIKAFLTEQNRGANIAIDHSRTVLLMDATGSMSNLLSAAKETVCTMFNRASTILKERGLPSDAFQMQFTVYRDYDCKEDGILQSSSWETRPQNLRTFMAGISASGGDDFEEAIEIGLWHAVQESETLESISQVILIADAPAKDRAAIKRDRKANGDESYWNRTKFKEPTHFTIELEKLKNKKIPVHAFYLVDDARDNFQRIAGETGGRCEQLNICSPGGAELLTNIVTEEVLRKAAGNQGDAAVELYRTKYVRRAFTS
ncbi:unnamed protein product [Rotaria socialis]|uniref:SecA family profile domain-containing protein n=2 Tax=Rotaria socialis TaxID=392032 RepID=A0A821I3S5_9BILA|nr:unnamed protein product [Rotaria socialis]CAF4698279.1 unnamed protein product [Rotaria socialis]